MKKLFLVLVLCLCSLASWAQMFNDVAPTGQTLYYNIVDNGVGVTRPNSDRTDPWGGYTQPTGSLTIPNSASNGSDSYPVTSIDEHAFSGCTGLTNVTIPNSVTSIGIAAFVSCTGLTNVTIPNSVTSIGLAAFALCNGLTHLIVPNSVTTIEGDAFDGIDTIYYSGSATGSPWEASVVITNYTETGDPLVYESPYKTMVIGCDTAATSVTIPNTVTTIENRAFQGCIGLTNVTIPNSVTSIGIAAFAFCYGLTNVTIPNSVTTIGESAFQGCIGLTNVTIPNSVTTIGESAFAFCYGLTNVTIPSSVTRIGVNAFYGCSGLTSVTIPSSVTSIGLNAFDGVGTVIYCGNAGGNPWGALRAGCFHRDGDFVFSDNTKTTLVCYIGAGRNVTIPNTVTTIGDYAFYGYTDITSVTVPSTVTSIDENAFDGVGTVVYCGEETGAPWGAERAVCSYVEGDFLFEDDAKTTLVGYIGAGGSVTIPSTVTTIAENAFKNCSTLTSVTVPTSVTTIKGYAFNGCTGLTSLTIPSSVTTIESYAFNGCANVTTLYYNATGLVTTDSWSNSYNYGFKQMPIESVVIGDNVETLPDYVFCGLGSLTSVTIPNSVTSIGKQAFRLCSSLASIELPESVTTIGNSAFSYCSSLESIEIPESVTSIGGSAFEDCSGLTSVSIPSSVTAIASHTFDGCSNLERVNIPNTVTSIGGAAFRDCGSLKRVAIPSSVTRIEPETFMNCGSLTSATVPGSVTYIGNWAFQNCSSLTSFVLHKSLSTVAGDAFSGCTSLKTVYNLTQVTFYAGNTLYGGVAVNALRILDSVRGFTNHGAGSNALHKIDNDTYTVVDEEDGTWNHIPRATIPANFLYYETSSAKAGGWRAKEVELTDDTSRFCAPVAFTADAVTYTREFTDGHRSTLYLPFTAANPEDLEVYEFSDFDGNILYFQEPSSTDSIRAYTPYLVGYGLEKSTTKCVISQKNAKFPATAGATPAYTTTHGGMTFQGTLARTGDLSTNNYGYKDGFFVQSGGAAHVNPFRCYFTYTGGGAGQMPPHTLSVAFGDGLLGIDAAETPATNGSIRYSNDVYDLMGRLVRKDAATLDGLPTGIYIWKGRKVLAR